MNKLLLTLLMFTSGFTLVAQTNFRSAGTGGWTTPGTWELESPDFSNVWVATLSTPTSASGIVTIRSPHIITFSSPIVVDEVTVDPGGELIVSSVTLTLANNPDGLYVDGSLTLLSGAAVSVPINNLIFRDGSTYNHDRDGGGIPVAVWEEGSTCSINGVTSIVPGGLAPSGGFWHFTWNSTQSAALNLLGQLVDINGNFEVRNTGGQILRLKSNQTSTLNIDGNFTVDIGLGTLSFSNGANTQTINLLGNLVLTSGTLTESGAGRGAINFNNPVAQSVTNNTGGSMSFAIDCTVSSSTTLTMVGESFLGGTGVFTLNGKLKLESLNATGALVTGTTLGNIRITTANRTYSSGSRIIYAGAGAQFIGNGNSGAAGVTTEIDNFLGVTNSGAVQVNDLILTTGNLQITNGSLTINGDVTPGSNFISVSGATTDLIINGPANLLTFPFPPGNPSFRDFTMNRPSGGVTFGNSAVTITRTTTLTSGRLIFDNLLTLGTVFAAGGNLVLGPGGDLGGLSSKSLVLNGNTALTSDLRFADNTLSTLTINKGNGGGISVSVIGDPLIVENTLTITDGQLNITNNNLTLGTASPGTLNLNSAGSISNSSPAGVPWNLVYSGTAVNPTGFEIPVSGSLRSISSGTSGTITLDQALSIGAGGFTLNSGTFNTGGNAIGTSFLTISAGTFTGLTSTVTLTGNLSIGGTYTNVGGNLVFNGTLNQSIGGTNAPTTLFSTVTINPLAILTAPTTLQIATRLTNNGTFNSGSGTNTVLFVSNATAKVIDGNSKITFNRLTVNGNATPNPDLLNDNIGGIEISGILDLGTNTNCTFDTDGGALLVDGGREFTLLSTADSPITADASIAQMNASAASPQVVGMVRVQRYMGLQGDAIYNFQVWRHISSPVNTNVVDIQAELPVVGPFIGTSTVIGATGDPSMYSYDQTLTGDLENGYTAFPVAANTELLTRGTGYSIFVFGSDPPVSTNGNANWDVRGSVWCGQFNMPVTFTSSAPTVIANDGWNLVGNPYPSTIDWSSASWTKTRVDNAIYMSDYSTANPVFASFVNGVSTNGGSRYIATGQGFWVKANAASPVLTIREAVKVAGTQTTFFRQSGPTDLIRITLSKDNLRDEAVIYFSDSATVAFDSKYDAHKFRNPYWYLNLSTISADEKYSINAMPLSACAAQVPLDVSDVTTGNYQLNFTEFESMSSAMKIQFRDNFTNALIDVRLNPNYSFAVDETDPNTFGSNRFSLAFTYEGGLVTIASETPGVCDPGTGLVNVTNSSSDYDYSLIKPSTGAVVVAATQGEDGPLGLYIPADQIAAGSNSFQVKATNRYCTNLESTVLVSISYAAAPAEVTVTAGTSCGTGHAVISASGAPADGHYNWYDSLEAVSPIPNEVLATYTTPELTSSKAYYVAAVNSLGCEGPWVEVMAIVSNLDPAVIEIVNAFTLQSNYQTGNQWYLNGNLIPGATSNTLQAVQSGEYRLDVTLNGCTVTDSKVFAVTAIEPSNSGAAGITIYPNPVKETLRVSVDADAKPVGSMYNLMGAYVGPVNFESSGSRYKGEYSFNKESSGFYFLRVERGSKVDVVRIIKD